MVMRLSSGSWGLKKQVVIFCMSRRITSVKFQFQKVLTFKAFLRLGQAGQLRTEGSKITNHLKSWRQSHQK